MPRLSARHPWFIGRLRSKNRIWNGCPMAPYSSVTALPKLVVYQLRIQICATDAKARKKTFTGYKEHVAGDLATKLILACVVTPANQPDHDAADVLKADIEGQGFEIGELNIDRGYLKSVAVEQLEKEGGEVVCKPWRIDNNNKGMFTKADLDINIRDKTITCIASAASAHPAPSPPWPETDPASTAAMVKRPPTPDLPACAVCPWGG